MSDLVELCKRFQVYETADKSDFQRRARLLQSIWREEQGLKVGHHKSRDSQRELGSRLKLCWAEKTLANFLTDTIRDVVRKEVLGPKATGKLYSKPRIFEDLLSSQPLCFNLFGELQRDLVVASNVFAALSEGRVAEVERIEFEWSPGRRDPKYTGDGTAFDVYVCFVTPSGGKGFVGIEVKYHENLQGGRSKTTERYEEIADDMGCFKESKRDALRKNPLQQIWRDHLLAGRHRLADRFEDGFFAFVYPEDNGHCRDAVTQYRDCLSDEDTFTTWTLEEVCATIQSVTQAPWIETFHDRYLSFDKIETYSRT